MARPIRILFPGAISHVTTWGNDRKLLFQGEEDRMVMQQKLATSLARYQVRLYAYVFMRNHPHLLVEMGGLSGREVAWQIGLASSAAS
jgi:REP element-mobilizing transposase RayT